MADFGGWLMPIEYPNSGVLAEHVAVRERVGIFDVSHLGKVSVEGEGALDFLNSIFTNDLNRIENGQAQYTLLCNGSGGVIDDLIAYRMSEREFFLIPNAANTSAVVAFLVALAPSTLKIENLHEKYGVIAIQGPHAPELLKDLGVEVDLSYMSFITVSIAGCEVILCRTGYTGEKGFEILPKSDEAITIWDSIVSKLAKYEGLICGLGARDTLRTEMGYPLHGHELTLDITPVEASASWAIGWKKGKFSGSERLVEQKSGKHRRLYALVSEDRGIPRAGMAVMNVTNAVIGEVTSGTFSPTLKKGIALAIISHELSVGDQVKLDIRGRESLCTVSALPLVPSHVR